MREINSITLYIDNIAERLIYETLIQNPQILSPSEFY